MAIAWKDEYNIGLEVIDVQHRKFVEILNELANSFLDPDNKEEVSRILDKLEEYAQTHFQFEEHYFHEFHYENMGEHEEAHRLFKLKIDKLRKRYESEEKFLEYDIFEFMNDWLLVHVLDEDKKFVECFKKNGLQ